MNFFMLNCYYAHHRISLYHNLPMSGAGDKCDFIMIGKFHIRKENISRVTFVRTEGKGYNDIAIIRTNDGEMLETSSLGRGEEQNIRDSLK